MIWNKQKKDLADGLTLEDEKEPSVWADTANLIRKNIFTILLLLVLIGLTVGAVVYRKKKNIDGDK